MERRREQLTIQKVDPPYRQTINLVQKVSSFSLNIKHWSFFCSWKCMLFRSMPWILELHSKRRQFCVFTCWANFTGAGCNESERSSHSCHPMTHFSDFHQNLCEFTLSGKTSQRNRLSIIEKKIESKFPYISRLARTEASKSKQTFFEFSILDVLVDILRNS